MNNEAWRRIVPSNSEAVTSLGASAITVLISRYSEQLGLFTAAVAITQGVLAWYAARTSFAGGRRTAYVAIAVGVAALFASLAISAT
jgi:hypothetical protein